MNGDFADYTNLSFEFNKDFDDKEKLMLAAVLMASTAIQVGMYGLLDPAQALADMSREIVDDLINSTPSITPKMAKLQEQMREVSGVVSKTAQDTLNLGPDEIVEVSEMVIDGIFRIASGAAGLLDILLLIKDNADDH